MPRAAPPPASTSEPLAKYSEHLLEVRRDFVLFPDRVVVTARWLLRGRFEVVVPLGRLVPGHRRVIVRYRFFRYAGWVLAIGALTFAALYYPSRGENLSPVALCALAVAVAGALGTALAYPLRRLEFARFLTPTGRPGLDVGVGRGDAATFAAFVRAVDREIPRSQRAPR
jgi:hypothetical protein